MSITLDKIFLAIVLYILFRLTAWVYKNFIRQRLNLKQRYGKDTWALVTGATDGIGKAFCEELAREGFNIILVSRNPEKLKTVANEIETSFKVSTHCIPFDFNARKESADYIKVFGSLNFDINILVNNVGASVRGNFMDNDIEAISNVLNCNILSQTYLTRLLGDKMRSKEHRCAIINVSSLQANRPMPYSALYSASKVFSYYLTESVALELNTKNIDFLCLKPAYTDTIMVRNLKERYCLITPKECVNSALNELGYELVTSGHWKHKIFTYVNNCLPIAFLRYKMRTRVTSDIKAD
jgi:17beta-estradiol 17-dehydrogenase / very-long-chain 3-oxoacyl-CoA reductase